MPETAVHEVALAVGLRAPYEGPERVAAAQDCDVPVLVGGMLVASRQVQDTLGRSSRRGHGLTPYRVSGIAVGRAAAAAPSAEPAKASHPMAITTRCIAEVG